MHKIIFGFERIITRTTKVVLEAQGNMFSAVCASSIYSLKVVFIF